ISEALPGGAIQPVSVEPDTLEIRDLSGLPEDARAAALHVHVQEQQHRPFDLRREVPLRSSLLRLDTERHALVTTFHHIGVDGVSLQYFYRDLAAFYDGAEPKPLRASYRQFADQDRRYWTGDRLEQRVAFWRETLAGAPAALDMPTDRSRGGSQSFTGSIVTRRLEGPGLAALRALAKSENATLFMAML